MWVWGCPRAPGSQHQRTIFRRARRAPVPNDRTHLRVGQPPSRAREPPGVIRSLTSFAPDFSELLAQPPGAIRRDAVYARLGERVRANRIVHGPDIES